MLIKEESTATREFYTFTEPNLKGEVVQFYICKVEFNVKNKNSLPHIWYKAGMTDKILPSYWAIQVYVTNKDNLCYGRYNPTINRDECKLNFEWVLEATEENKQKLIDKITELSFTAV